MIISWIYEFLLMIHIISLEDCIISCELDKENHKVHIKYYMWTHIQWLEKMIHDNTDTHIFWFWSEMCS